MAAPLLGCRKSSKEYLSGENDVRGPEGRRGGEKCSTSLNHEEPINEAEIVAVTQTEKR